MKNERWTIGSEFDSPLVGDVRRLLLVLGYAEDSHWTGVAGSQDIAHWEYVGSKGRLILEAETYIGLTLVGPENLVIEVREAFQTSQQMNL